MDSVASPTVLIEALFTTLVIVPYEDRDIKTFDAQGAYLNTEIPRYKRDLLKLQGHFVDIMRDINPQQKANMIYENEKFYYIYLCYRLFTNVLNRCCCSTSYTLKWSKKGYNFNKEDRCVLINMIKWKQCKITWCVDDNKASHANTKVISELLEDLKKNLDIW